MTRKLMIMKKSKSAKDISFDKERAKYRKEIRELNSQVIKQRIDIDRLKQDIGRKDIEIAEKDEWIRRLLEYMDMSEEDMRKIIQKDKTMSEFAERLSDINKMVSRFFW